jgi:hypothetical protein
LVSLFVPNGTVFSIELRVKQKGWEPTKDNRCGYKEDKDLLPKIKPFSRIEPNP